MFWNLGILVFSETLSFALDGQSPVCDPTISSKMQGYQWSGASSIAAMVACILSLPPDEASSLQNGLTTDLPFASCHVNLSLVVTALVKAIEHIINLQIPPTVASEPRLDGDVHPAPCHLKSLMSCLVSLDTTVSGSHTARVAVKDMMQQYGDILSECWSPGNTVGLRKPPNMDFTMRDGWVVSPLSLIDWN